MQLLQSITSMLWRKKKKNLFKIFLKYQFTLDYLPINSPYQLQNVTKLAINTLVNLFSKQDEWANRASNKTSHLCPAHRFVCRITSFRIQRDRNWSTLMNCRWLHPKNYTMKFLDDVICEPFPQSNQSHGEASPRKACAPACSLGDDFWPPFCLNTNIIRRDED